MENSQRAGRVHALIDAYREFVDEPDASDASPEAILVRMLADVHHYCFQRGLRIDALLHPADRQFHQELESDTP